MEEGEDNGEEGGRSSDVRDFLERGGELGSNSEDLRLERVEYGGSMLNLEIVGLSKEYDMMD